MSQIATLSAVNANSGTLFDTDANWTTVRVSTSAESATTAVTTSIEAGKPTNYDIRRMLLEFNTSNIPAHARINSAILTPSGAPDSNDDNTFAVLTGSTAISGALAVTMYNDLVLNNPTELATRVSIGGNLALTLNIAGKLYIETELAKENNFIKFFIRNSRDVDNVTPIGENDITGSIGGNSSLFINYTVNTMNYIIA